MARGTRRHFGLCQSERRFQRTGDPQGGIHFAAFHGTGSRHPGTTDQVSVRVLSSRPPASHRFAELDARAAHRRIGHCSVDRSALAARCGRKDLLSARTSDRLASADLAEYRVIVDRNLFGIGGGSLDEADFAYLTAIIEADGEPEVWFTLRASGELLKLRHGQSFQIGALRGSVAEINDSDVILLCDDERWLVGVGENLMQASTLPPEF